MVTGSGFMAKDEEHDSSLDTRNTSPPHMGCKLTTLNYPAFTPYSSSSYNGIRLWFISLARQFRGGVQLATLGVLFHQVFTLLSFNNPLFLQFLCMIL